MKPAPFILLFSCALIALFAACSPMQTAGNGSEITNGIVVSEAGPADSATVIAFPAAYIPCVRRNTAAPETTFTDVQGAFHLRLADTAWNLLIYDRTRHLGTFIPRLKGEPDMGVIKLDSLGGIIGSAEALKIDVLKQTFVGIAGSPFFTDVIKDSSFFISLVPPYAYQVTMWVYRNLTSEQPILEMDNVIANTTVLPGMTTSIILNY